jgi:hypothetical protein
MAPLPREEARVRAISDVVQVMIVAVREVNPTASSPEP